MKFSVIRNGAIVTAAVLAAATAAFSGQPTTIYNPQNTHAATVDANNDLHVYLDGGSSTPTATNATIVGPLGTGSAASSVRTLTVPGSVTSPAPYVYTALGCGQIAAFSASTLLSSVAGGIPAGATLASLSVETNAVRYRDDGTAPTATVGTPLAAGLSAWPYSGNLAAIRFIPQTGNATIDVCFYQ